MTDITSPKIDAPAYRLQSKSLGRSPKFEFHLPSDELAALAKAANSLGVSKAALIRAAVKSYISRELP